MKVKNSIVRFLLIAVIMIVSLFIGNKVSALTIENPVGAGPHGQPGNGNPDAYFCIENWVGWGVKSNITSVSIDNVISEYEEDLGSLEASIKFGLYTANIENNRDINIIQYLVWSSGYYKGLPGYVDTLQKYSPADRKKGMEYEIVQRADQYAKFYYGILGGGQELKINVHNDNSKVFIDQKDHKLIVGPYQIEIDSSRIEEAKKQARYASAIDNAETVLYNELTGVNKKTYPNAPEFAKYNLTGIDGKDIEFLDRNGNTITFPNFNSDKEEDRTFYIKCTPNDGVKEVNPKINIEYIKDLNGSGSYCKAEDVTFKGTRTDVDIVDFNKEKANSYVNGNIWTYDAIMKDDFEIITSGGKKYLDVTLDNATPTDGYWKADGYHVTSFSYEARLTSRNELQDLVILNFDIKPEWTNSDVDLGLKDISIELGGHTWKDLPSPKVGGYDGIRNKEDEAYAGMLVQLFDKDGNLVRTTTTDANGEYHFKKLDPFKKYYVIFTYNGQLYMATAYQNNIAWDGGFSNAKEEGTKEPRDKFNQKFQKIDATPKNYDGKRAFPFLQKIQKDGTMTFEEVWNSFEKANIADNSTVSDENIANSYENGYSAIASVYDAKAIRQYIEDCMIESKTPVSYPVYDKFVTEDLSNPPDKKTQLKVGNISFNFLYTKESDQSRFVDFGVYRRETLELALQKDLYKATVQINGKEHEYIYNKKTEAELKNRDWYVSIRPSDYLYNGGIYNRALRKSEYLYDGNIYDGALQDANNASKNLQVYVTYRIAVLNRSQSLKATINEIVDYYDKKQFTFVKATVNPDDEVSTIGTGDSSTTGNVNEIEGKGFGTKYITEDINLAPGELRTFYITFKVNEDANTKKVMLDLNTVGKRNIAEITGYSTSEGIVDSFSNPGNLENADLDKDGNILPRGYEPDTDKAPNFKLIIDTESGRDRIMSGYVFEDIRTDKYNNSAVGNGFFNVNDKDKKVNGVKVELVELVQKVDESGKSTGEYLGEKVWGTVKYNNNFDIEGEDTARYYSGYGKSKVIITGPEGTVFEVKPDTIDNPDGEYAFKSVPPGDFFIRFTYGDNEQTVLINADSLPTGTDEEKAYKNNVTAVNSLLGKGGLNAKSYNGQDFKSTVYQASINQNTVKPSYNNIKGFTDVENQNYNNGKDKSAMYVYDFGNNANSISDAKDVYSYRENVNNWSKGADGRSLVNNRSEILASFEKVGTGIKTAAEQQSMINTLIEKTQMVAQTGMIDTQIEFNSTNTNTSDKEGNARLQETSKQSYDYVVGDVDLGLAERPRAQLKLNKEVSNLKITLASGNVIFNSNQQINNLIFMKHEGHKAIHENNILTGVKVGTNSEKSKPELIQAYMDEELIAGSNIEATYKLSVENVGEVDYKDKNFYYTGKTIDGSESNVSKTNARTVIDYVSNLIEYDGKYQHDDSKWAVKNAGQIITSSSLNKDGSINITGNIDADYVNRHYLDKVSTYNILLTTDSLKGDLLPTIENKGNNSRETSLVLTKKLSNTSGDEEFIYNNLSEIVEISNEQGRRMQFSVVGNQEMADQSIKTKNAADGVNTAIKIVTPSEIDADSAQKIVILPPLGEKHIMPVLIAVVASLSIIAISIVVIKKYAK